MTSSIPELLSRRRDEEPEAVIFAEVGGATLTRRQLWDAVLRWREMLAESRVPAGSVIAVATVSNLQSAVSLVAAMCAGVAAPFDAQAPAEERRRFLARVGARAVFLPTDDRVTLADEPSPTVLRRTSDGLPSGSAARPGIEVAAAELGREVTARLLLQTSGSTGEPLLVALDDRNILAGARASAAAYRLDERDVRLNVMPLFHVQGVVGSLMTAIASGGRVVFAPRFAADQLAGWVNRWNVTWYSATPAMHRAAIEQWNGAVPSMPTLRFVRSGSGYIAPELIDVLERSLGVPLVVSYGLTEAHQVASTPLPPAERRVGSAGVATGSTIRIEVRPGVEARPNEAGDILVRGANVIDRYPDQKVTGERLDRGWLRTGDVGYLDPEGYLWFVGRKRELIDRAGEKIAPTEVERVLEQHPGVREACVIGLPDQLLGEEVAAVVVTEVGHTLDVDELRRAAARSLAVHKVPRRIFVLPSLRKNSMGKIQRGAVRDQILERLATTAAQERTQEVCPVDDAITMAVRMLWSQVLSFEKIDLDEDFFSLGGDSITGARLRSLVKRVFDVEIPVMAMYEELNTVRRMSKFVVLKKGLPADG